MNNWGRTGAPFTNDLHEQKGWRCPINEQYGGREVSSTNEWGGGGSLLTNDIGELKREEKNAGGM